MEERYNAYNRDTTASTTPNVPVTPSAPTRGARIHLCLEADQRTSELLDALDRANGWATFYCTPDFLESNGELLRRMADVYKRQGLRIPYQQSYSKNNWFP